MPGITPTPALPLRGGGGQAAIAREAVMAAARGWLGTPWRDKGRTARGLDCVGLVIVTARALGIAVADHADYPRATIGMTPALGRALDARLVRRPIARHAPGAVLLFRDSPFPRHIGIGGAQDGRPTLIHARQTDRRHGVVGEEPFAHDWPDLLIGAWDFPGVAPWPS